MNIKFHAYKSNEGSYRQVLAKRCSTLRTRQHSKVASKVVFEIEAPFDLELQNILLRWEHSEDIRHLDIEKSWEDCREEQRQWHARWADDASPEERVERGAALMAQHNAHWYLTAYSEGWYKLQKDFVFHPLALAFPGYNTPLRAVCYTAGIELLSQSLDLNPVWRHFGFNPRSDEEADALAAAWRAKIRALVHAPGGCANSDMKPDDEAFERKLEAYWMSRKK